MGERNQENIKDRKRLLEELFGSDEEDENEREKETTQIQQGKEFNQILPGLLLFTQFLNNDNKNNKNNISPSKKINKILLPTANELLDEIMELYPFTENLNQVMSFGELPSFILPIVEELELTSNLFPKEIMERKPLFDQMICNYYEPGQGITPHVDLLNKFDDGIVIVSLGSSCVMDFRPVRNLEQDQKYNEAKELSDEEKISVLLQPGDVLSISGDARYKWTHGIEKKTEDVWEGENIPRGKRVSVTLRRLLPNVNS